MENCKLIKDVIVSVLSIFVITICLSIVMSHLKKPMPSPTNSNQATPAISRPSSLNSQPNNAKPEVQPQNVFLDSIYHIFVHEVTSDNTNRSSNFGFPWWDWNIALLVIAWGGSIFFKR